MMLLQIQNDSLIFDLESLFPFFPLFFNQFVEAPYLCPNKVIAFLALRYFLLSQ